MSWMFTCLFVCLFLDDPSVNYKLRDKGYFEYSGLLELIPLKSFYRNIYFFTKDLRIFSIEILHSQICLFIYFLIVSKIHEGKCDV